MKEKSNKRAVLVGLFVFIGLIFLLGGILMVGNLHDTFKNKMNIVSLFEDVSGLKKGNNIWFSGVKIGTVSDLRFYGKSQVVVSMNVETKTQQYIRKDAKVKISSDGLIGNKILIIYGGTEKFGLVQEGDTLGVDKTISTEDMINTLQENNKNFLSITSDFKTISKKLVTGEGTIGKLLNDNSLYNHLDATAASLQTASNKASQLVASLTVFSEGLNKKGTLVNEITTDTVVFKSVKSTVIELQQIADTARLFISKLKEAGSNPKSAVGVLLYDEASGNHLKETIKNLESSSIKLDEDLEAAKHNILLRGFFKKQAKAGKPALPIK
ncbi:MAG: MCE family protein [Bacteroidetes bacterium]|nr:MCE family protein [Bacteroidota bacterium]